MDGFVPYTLIVIFWLSLSCKIHCQEDPVWSRILKAGDTTSPQYDTSIDDYQEDLGSVHPTEHPITVAPGLQKAPPRQECTQKGGLFIDESFPADNRGLYSYPATVQGVSDHDFDIRRYFKKYHDLDVDKDPIRWMRPAELCREMGWAEPQFTVDGFSKVDVNQGRIGNSWFVAPLSIIAEHERFRSKVIPEQPEFGDCYTGKFRFVIWHDGQWTDVTVDDRLPCETKDGKVVGLLGVNNPKQPNEFWAALLEKAYAKVNGRSYEAILYGFVIDAMIDFTGGAVKKRFLYELDFEVIEDYFQEGALLAVGRHGNMNDDDTIGLVYQHTYSVVDVKRISTKKNEELNLIRLRNPYGSRPSNGMEVEWKGAWSDTSERWREVDEDLREELLSGPEDDGQFWMEYIDLKNAFDSVTICTVLDIQNQDETKYEDELERQSQTDDQFEAKDQDSAEGQNEAGERYNEITFLDQWTIFPSTTKLERIGPVHQFALRHPRSADKGEKFHLILSLSKSNYRDLAMKYSTFTSGITVVWKKKDGLDEVVDKLTSHGNPFSVLRELVVESVDVLPGVYEVQTSAQFLDLADIETPETMEYSLRIISNATIITDHMSRKPHI